jgi:adenylate kinase
LILILGNPGAGKTTQTRLLAKRLDCPWFSMGDLIRSSVTGQVRQEMLAGKIISDDVTLKIVDTALNTVDTSKKVVFEGNPRSIGQAKWWVDQQAAGRFKVVGLIHMVADPAVAERRMVKRGRLDDHNEDVIDKRYAEYRRSIKPTLDYLVKHGIKVHEINANGTIKQVANSINQALGL